eukprot:scaffold149_cov315-Pinguiococcus_pyrenoidosus.AAC.57
MGASTDCTRLSSRGCSAGMLFDWLSGPGTCVYTANSDATSRASRPSWRRGRGRSRIQLAAGPEAAPGACCGASAAGFSACQHRGKHAIYFFVSTAVASYDSKVRNSSNSISPLPSVSILLMSSSMSIVRPKSYGMLVRDVRCAASMVDVSSNLLGPMAWAPRVTCLMIFTSVSRFTWPVLSERPPQATKASIMSVSSSKFSARSF